MRLTQILLVGALLSSNMWGAGTVIFTNFGDSQNPYSTQNALSVSTGDAISFLTPSTLHPGASAWALDSIEFVGSVADPSRAIDVSLYSDSGGLPGSSIETLTALLTSDPTDRIVTSVETPTLNPGTTYWLVLSDPNAPSNPNFLSWFDAGTVGSNQPPTGVATNGEGGWSFDPNRYTQGVARVTADEVFGTPEPGTFLALGSGLLLLGARRLRQR